VAIVGPVLSGPKESPRLSFSHGTMRCTNDLHPIIVATLHRNLVIYLRIEYAHMKFLQR